MPFPNSNLSSNAQPWARDVQKRIESLESNVKANEINNTARDVQLDNNYKRLDQAVNDLIVADAAIIVATEQAQDAADAAAAAASTANSAATAAQNAADDAADAAAIANNAIAILSSLTTTTYYPNATGSWATADLPAYIIDYYGSTYVDIPESGGSRKVTVTAVFDVDCYVNTSNVDEAARQNITAHMYGSDGSTLNSMYNGGRITNSSATTDSMIRVYGGGSLTVIGEYSVYSSGYVSWNPDLYVNNSFGTGTMAGAANLRFVTVTVTKV